MNDTKPQKRKYVSLACNNCREAHRSCDGEIPCRRCRSRYQECVYDKPKPSPRRIVENNIPVEKGDNTAIEKASPVPQCTPTADIHIYLNYYALEFKKTAPNFQSLPASCSTLPLNLNSIRDDQKFRVCATLGLTALTLGHVTQGHMLMDHANIDAAIGFNNLASCHMMEFDFLPTTHYLKLSKTVAQTIWKMQRRDSTQKIETEVASVLTHAIIRSLQLDLTSFNSDGNFGEAVRWTKKKVDQLSDVVQKTLTPLSDIISFASGLFSFYMAEIDCVFEAIQKIEIAARNLAGKWKEHSNIYVHLVGSLKFALLQDDSAVKDECRQSLQVFDRLTTHNCRSMTAMHTTALLWSALGLDNELQHLASIAQRISSSFPGGKFIAERFGKQREPGDLESDLTRNPFAEILTKYNANNRIGHISNSIIEIAPSEDMIQDPYSVFDEIVANDTSCEYDIDYFLASS